MNISTIFVFSVLFPSGIAHTLAQETPPATERVTLEVKDDVSRAAIAANVTFSDAWLSGFVDSAADQPIAFDKVYKSVPRDVRVARLARYLMAKGVLEGKPPSRRLTLTEKDLGDFHWSYVGRDTVYSKVQMKSASPAKLLFVDTTDGQYQFGKQAFEIQPGGVILVPRTSTKGDSTSTLQFDLGDNKKALWTGDPDAGQLVIVAAGTTKGCEIFVNSRPDKATVYFNGSKWYVTTNTSSVRPAGRIEVVLQLLGHKQWRETRTLGPGESWTIEAALAEQ